MTSSVCPAVLVLDREAGLLEGFLKGRTEGIASVQLPIPTIASSLQALQDFEEVISMEPKNYLGDDFSRITQVFRVAQYNLACCYSAIDQVQQLSAVTRVHTQGCTSHCHRTPWSPYNLYPPIKSHKHVEDRHLCVGGCWSGGA